MAYIPTTDFSAYQTINPTSPLPGSAVDAELANIATETAALATKIDDVRRSDGALKNEIVTPDSLHADTVALLASYEEDAETAADAGAASASAAAASASGAATSASAASASATAATASATSAASAASGVAADAATAVAAKEDAEAAAEDAEDAVTAAAASASSASTNADTASTAAGTATTQATAAASSAGAAAASATAAEGSNVAAAVSAASADASAVSAGENALAAAAAAVAADLSLAAVEAVYDALVAADLTVAAHDVADPRTTDLTIAEGTALTYANRDQEFTISDGTDRVITIEAGAYLDAENPNRRIKIPLHRLGDGAGKLIVEFEDGTPASSTVPEGCGSWATYGLNDNDDVAATAGNDMYDGDLPAQTVVGDVGNDRIVLSYLMIQSNIPVQEERFATCEIDGVSATIAIAPDQETSDGNPLIAIAVRAIPDLADGTDNHTVEWFTNDSPREGQAIASRVFKNCDLASIYEAATRDPNPFGGGVSDGTHYVKSVTMADPGASDRLAVVCLMSCSGNLTGVTGTGGTESLAPANTGSTNSRAISYLIRELADIDANTTFEFKRPVAQSNALANGAGLLLRPKVVAGSPAGVVLTDDNVAAELTRENQAAVLVLHADGETARLLGV